MTDKAKKKRSSKAKAPRLERVDLHKHPQQGTQPYQGPPAHPHPSEAPAWNPFRSMPLHPHAAGASGFTTGDVHVPGPFMGIGPRNYTKTDQRILEDVCELLTRHGELDVRAVDVHCRNGVIRLEGSVPSRWARREIEAVADSVGGVQDVQNDLTIASPE
jgi:hypothetical protein